MKPEEIALLSIVVSGIMSAITLAIGRFLSRRVDLAGAKSQEGDAAKALSEAARTQLETYNKEVIQPMKQELGEVRALNESLEKSLNEEKDRNHKMIAALQDEIARFKMELRRADDSLEYLVSATRVTYPNEVEVAYKIRRGELHL